MNRMELDWIITLFLFYGAVARRAQPSAPALVMRDYWFLYIQIKHEHLAMNEAKQVGKCLRTCLLLID